MLSIMLSRLSDKKTENLFYDCQSCCPLLSDKKGGFYVMLCRLFEKNSLTLQFNLLCCCMARRKQLIINNLL